MEKIFLRKEENPFRAPASGRFTLCRRTTSPRIRERRERTMHNYNKTMVKLYSVDVFVKKANEISSNNTLTQTFTVAV